RIEIDGLEAVLGGRHELMRLARLDVQEIAGGDVRLALVGFQDAAAGNDEDELILFRMDVQERAAGLPFLQAHDGHLPALRGFEDAEERRGLEFVAERDFFHTVKRVVSASGAALSRTHSSAVAARMTMLARVTLVSCVPGDRFRRPSRSESRSI